jgi:hypothetical protein
MKADSDEAKKSGAAAISAMLATGGAALFLDLSAPIRLIRIFRRSISLLPG